jgi:hypothetical protein
MIRVVDSTDRMAALIGMPTQAPAPMLMAVVPPVEDEQAGQERDLTDVGGDAGPELIAGSLKRMPEPVPAQ